MTQFFYRSARITLLVFSLLIAVQSNVFAANSNGKSRAEDPKTTERAFEKSFSKQAKPWYSPQKEEAVYLPQDTPTYVEARGRSPWLDDSFDSVANWIVQFLYWAAITIAVAAILIVVFFAVRRQWKAARFKASLAEDAASRARRIETLAPEAAERYDDLFDAAKEAAERKDFRAAMIYYFS